MKGRCKQPIGKELILGVEVTPGYKLPDSDAMPEHKLKEVKIGSIKSETKVKIEQKKRNWRIMTQIM